jgi:hypothetical protein
MCGVSSVSPACAFTEQYRPLLHCLIITKTQSNLDILVSTLSSNGLKNRC